MQIEFLLKQAMIVVLLGLFLVLVVRALRGDFWPGRLRRLYREGKQSVHSEDDS